MKITANKILKASNISDSGCETKLERLNDILAMFALQCFESYTLKTTQGFNFAGPETEFETKYPISRVWGFVTNCKCVGCSIKPMDCCEGWVKLLVNQGWLGELDRNQYAIEFPNKIHLNVPMESGRGILIYSRGFPELKSLDDEIEIDRYTLALLRQYIKMDYALDSDSDSTLYNYLSKRLESRIEQLNKAFGNHILMVQPGGVQIKAQSI